MAQNLDLVEKLIERTGISYGEAKAALEETGWDILEALIMLEAQGRVRETGTSRYSTNSEAGSDGQSQPGQDGANAGPGKEKSASGENFKKFAKRFGLWIRDLVDKGNKNSLRMHRKNEKLIDLPVTVFLLLLIFCFWVVLPLMIVALFFGCRFSFSGNELGKDGINNAMGKATDIADEIKQEFKS
ncbi:MAG: DUF4342 domain-containing protein [Oscillospiraceae bacterium]|jgi:hypothetical protein|nr:DUF4342 domain-containing protein [Oscillospiraceae bacterium]